MTFECTYIIAYVVNLRSGDDFESLEFTSGILEVMQALEGILEVGGGLRRETVLWVFQWVFVLWCANF